jgi:hypothetical protein
MAREVGADVVIVGTATTRTYVDDMFAPHLSCRAVISISALLTQNAEALSAKQLRSGGLGLSEEEAIQEALDRISPVEMESFARRLLKKWHIGVAEQKIAPNTVLVGTPPTIQIDVPANGEVIQTEAVRLQARAADDRGIRSIQLSVNNTEISLTENHIFHSRSVEILPTGAPAITTYQISRLIPLNPGPNVIRLVAHDTDNNPVDVTQTVVRLVPSPPTAGNNESQPNADITIEIQTPKDGQTVDSEFLSLQGRASSTQQVMAIQVFVNESEVPTSGKMFALEGVSSTPATSTGLAFQRALWLSPGTNRIEVIATTNTGATAKEALTVIRGEKMEPPATSGEKYAIIIGIGNYQDAWIPKLRFTRSDAERFREFLVNRGGFLADNVKLLIDEAATLKNLRTTIGTWLAERAKPEDTVILYYSGHGGLERDFSGEAADGQNRYLINYDADAENLYATALPNPELALMLGRIQSQKFVFFLDCCYSGGAASGDGVVKSFNQSLSVVTSDVYSPLAGQGRVVISASKASQMSYEHTELNHGIFTYYLLHGLDGKADLDGDEAITLLELYFYLVKTVDATAQEKVGKPQTPTFFGVLEGNLTLVTRP